MFRGLMMSQKAEGRILWRMGWKIKDFRGKLSRTMSLNEVSFLKQ